MAMAGRGSISCLALCAALLVLSLCPISSASSGDVSIVQVNDGRTIEAGGSASFAWVVHNEGPDPLLIVPTLTTALPDRLSWTLEPSCSRLDPNGSCRFYLTFSAEADMYPAVIPMTVVFNITDMAANSSEEVAADIVLEARSAFGAIDRNNKILGVWDNFLPAPLDGNWGAFGLSLLIWVGIGLLALKGLEPALHRLARRTRTRWDKVVAEVIKLPLLLLVLAYGIVSSLEILNLSPALLTDLELAYMIAVVLIASLLAYRVLVRIVAVYGAERSLNGRNGNKKALVNSVSLLGKVVIPVVAAFIIAGMLGMDLGNAILGVGFLGLVIGYATQSALGNIFAGLQLLLDRPFKVGDRVPLNDGHTARVLDVGLLTTKFLDLDTFEEVIMPNSLIESQAIVNMNAPDARWKSSVKVRVSSDEDPKRIEELMMEAARRTPNILQGREAPVVRVSEVGDGRMLLTIFIWIDDVANRHLARTEYRRNLVKVFKENGVEFALPRKIVSLNRQSDERSW